MKPMSPLLNPYEPQLKPMTPLQAKNAPKTPVSHSQRRRRFHTRDFRCRWAVAGPGRALSRRVELPNSDQAPLVWRAAEGLVGLAAVPVGGGRAWPGFETTRRAKLAARTTRGRAAAHGHTKQPGPPGRASARNTRGATSNTNNRACRRPRRSTARQGAPAPGTQQQHTARARSAVAPRAPASTVSAHRLSWMLRPGTASISSRV